MYYSHPYPDPSPAGGGGEIYRKIGVQAGIARLYAYFSTIFLPYL
jgi:hypothetical protein